MSVAATLQQLALIASIAGGAVQSARAQNPPPIEADSHPLYPAMFPGETTVGEIRPVSLTLSLFGATDRGRPRAPIDRDDATTSADYGGVAMVGNVRRATSLTIFALDASGVGSRSGGTSGDQSGTGALRASLGWIAGTRTRLDLAQTLHYASAQGLGSWFVFEPIDRLSEAPVVDLQLAARDVVGYSSHVTLTHRLARRTQLQITGDAHGDSVLAGPLPHASLHSQQAGFDVLHMVSRSVWLRGGYAYQRNLLEQGDPLLQHRIDAGIQLDRPLTRSRRARFSASSGVSLVPQTTAAQERQHLVLTGTALFARHLGRTGVVGLGVERSVEYAPGLAAPMIATAPALSFAGQPSRRIDVSAVARTPFGQVGFQEARNGFRSAEIGGLFRVALSPRWAIFAQGRYASFQFDSPATAPSYFAEGLRRTSARIGVSWWIPLAQSGARP